MAGWESAPLAGDAANGPAWASAPAEGSTALRANALQPAAPPDAAASAARLSRQTGLPFDLVARNHEQVQRRVTADTIEANTAAAPALRERYADPAFASMAGDDSARLAALESTVTGYTFGNALKKGVAGAKLTLDFLADRLAGAVGADTTETRRILGETGTYYRSQGSDPQLQAAGERARVAGGGTWYGTLLNLPGEVAAEENPFQIIGKFMTEQLPASLVGFGLGAAATAPARAAIASRITSEMVARGVSTGIAGAAGNSTAVVLQSLGTNFEEGRAQGLADEAAASRAWTKTLGEVPANAVAGAVMGLRIGPNQLTNIIGQSVAQGAGGGTGAAMASAAVGEEADPLEIALEILGEAVSAGPELAGLTFSRIADSRAVQRANAAAAATEDAVQLGEMVQAADASALKQRDSQTFGEFVDQVQPEARVYVAPEHLAGADLSAVPEVAAQVTEAQATGGDVQLTLGDLLAHLPAEQLLPHLRTEPEAMTASEAQAFDGTAEIAAELAAPAAAIEGAMFTGPEQAGLSADAWATYQQQAAQSAEAAVQTREGRALRDLKWLANRKDEALRAVQREADTARAAIEPQVLAEVQQIPVYAAQRWLKTGVLPDGTQTVGAKLNTTALREMYGEGPAAPWRYLATNMVTAEEGLHPDVVAEMFGYASGDAMVRDIVGAQKQADVVEARVEQRMLEEHPEIADRIAQEREAEARIADRARVRLLATEAAALSQAVGNRVLLAAEAQRYALESIARRKVADLRPAQYRAAARRAGAEADASFAKGDVAMAAKRKQSQVLQTALHDEARTAATEITQALRAFRRIVSTGNDGRDGNLADTARAVLAQYGLAQTNRSADEYLSRVQRYDPDLHADLRTLMEELPAPADHKALTVGEFRAMRDRVQAIWSLARSTRQIEIDGRAMEINQAATGLAEQLSFEPTATRETMVGTNERLDLRMRLAGVRAALRRVEFWADARDRGDRFGPFRRYVWQPVSEAVTRYRAERNRYVNQFRELLKPIEPTLKPGKIAAPELGDGMVFADRSALLHALLHTGNESNQRKLLLGYRWATEREDGSLDTSRWDAFLSRMHAEGRITAADWQFVQGVWDLNEQMKPAAQQAHRRMFGFYFDEITAAPVQTPFGELGGGYVPAITDPLLVPEGRQHGAMDDLLAGQNSPMFPAVNRGFSKARDEDYTRPLALDLRLMPAHIDKVMRFAHLGPVLRDTARLVMRNRVFRAAMDAVDPTAVESLLAPWLKRVATQTLNEAPTNSASRAVARMANAVRNRTGLMLMAGNVINTAQQVTGFAVTMLRVKPRHLAAGFTELMRSPVEVGNSINELSEWMRQRSDNSARDVDQAIERLLTNPSARQQAEQFGNRFGYVLQQAAQNFIDRVVWLGAYREAQADGRADAQAVRDADAAVRMTQSSFAPEDAAAVESQHPFVRMFLMFYSYFSGQANLLATEAQNARALPTMQATAARLALVYLLGFAIPAFMAEVIAKGMRGDLGGDDEDDLAGEMLKLFFTSQARYALGMLPVAGQVGNAAMGIWVTPERFDDRLGLSPAAGAIESTLRAPVSIVKAWNDEGNPRTAVRDGLTAVGLLTGLPTGPLVRPLGYLADENRGDGVTLRGLVTGKASAN